MNLFLHFKPEVLPTFQKNYNFLHSQFEKIMKVLQSDLGERTCHWAFHPL